MFSIEIIRKPRPESQPCAAILDFDGTISLIREGWHQVMIPLFIEVLGETPLGKIEPPRELERCVRDFVDFLTGKQTIYQCIRLAEEVTKRNGTTLEPLEYKQEYHRRLSAHIEHRIHALQSGDDPINHVVPGSYDLLEMLRRRGLRVYLASGTDEIFVKEEAALLRVTDYFDGGIFGAQDKYQTFSKAQVIQRIISENNLDGHELVGFGDGYVEIQNVREIGGFAVGVATNESERCGVNQWKRNRLIDAGADLIIPDYSDIAKLEQQIFSREQQPE